MVLPSKRLPASKDTTGAAASSDSLGWRAVLVRSRRQAKHAYLSADILVESLSQHLVESFSHALPEGIADQHPPCVQKQNCGTTKATRWFETLPCYCVLFFFLIVLCCASWVEIIKAARSCSSSNGSENCRGSAASLSSLFIPWQ